jgi:hypothetical protein
MEAMRQEALAMQVTIASRLLDCPVQTSGRFAATYIRIAGAHLP